MRQSINMLIENLKYHRQQGNRNIVKLLRRELINRKQIRRLSIVAGTIKGFIITLFLALSVSACATPATNIDETGKAQCMPYHTTQQENVSAYYLEDVVFYTVQTGVLWHAEYTDDLSGSQEWFVYECDGKCDTSGILDVHDINDLLLDNLQPESGLFWHVEFNNGYYYAF